MIITSRQNQQVKRLRALMGEARFRKTEREYACEGFKLFNEAKRFAEITSVFLSEEIVGIDTGDLPVFRASPDIIQYASGQSSPQGLIFTCRLPERALPDRLCGRYIVLDGISDPGNMGAIIRTADAFGLDGLLLCGSCADIYNPKTVRAAMGGLFRLPAYECRYDQLADRLELSDLPFFRAQAVEGAVPACSAGLGHAVVAIGSEANGLSQELVSIKGKDIIIPMRGGAESLNAAVAASIIMWEMVRG